MVKWLENCGKLRDIEVKRMINNILATCRKHRDHIRHHQLLDIEEWVGIWQDHELMQLT